MGGGHLDVIGNEEPKKYAPIDNIFFNWIFHDGPKNKAL